MKRISRLLLALIWMSLIARAADEPPTEWIDPDTGHRVVQLSREPGTASLYFTQNAYTAGGTKLMATLPHGLATIDLKTGAIKKIVENHVVPIATGRKTGAVYYQTGGFVYAVDPATGTSRQIVKLPGHGNVSTVNADETLLAGTITGGAVPPEAKPDPRDAGHDNYPSKGAMMEHRLAAHLPMILFTLNTQTGEYRELLHSTDWLNHLQFSPADPALLMFCHEGPWHKVDRIWTIRTDGKSTPMLVHQRTMKMEIAGHEFWSADGQWIWYDLQTPRGEDFWVAGYNVKNGKRIRYHLQRDEWSVHYNVSPDGMLFAGDGGASGGVAHATGGKWIYLFHPQLISDKEVPPDQDSLIQAGVFRSERLVNLSAHDYSLEPNVNFTPDGKWIVFRSNMRGATQVYAVEIAKAKK